MDNEIEEMQEIINNCYKRSNCIEDNEYCIDTKEASEALCNAGYHKTIWHKVADGDLPAQLKDVLCVTEDIFTKDKVMTVGCITENNLWFLESDILRWHDIEDVLAWTELPKYKE